MRILWLTANFAPRGTSADVRVVNLVKFLARQGHEVHIVTRDKATLSLFFPIDNELGAKVPPEVGVTRIPPGLLRGRVMRRVSEGKESGTAYKYRLKSNLLLPLLVPDPQVDGVPNFIRAGSRQVERFFPSVVMTNSYPFSMHLVGAWLKRRYPRVCWVADYGDPWSGSVTSELPWPRWRQKIDYHLERFLLRRADQVTVTTEATRELYSRLFPFNASNITVLPMGFDPEDFETILPKVRPPEERDRIWLVHTGRIYTEARDPLPFVKALAEMVTRDPAILKTLRVVLVGGVEESLKMQMMTSPAKDLISLVPWVPVHESIAWMKAADYLLLFGNKGGLQIPGKVYQYLGSGRPVFMTSLLEGDPTAKIALTTPGSVVVENKLGHILDALQVLLCKGRVAPASRGAAADSPYAWPQIALKLTQAIGRIKEEDNVVR